MALSISQLSNPPTRSEITEWMIETLQEFGFQATGWQPGRVQHIMLNVFATIVAAFFYVVVFTVKSGFNSYATGPALTLFSRSRYDEERTKAQQTAGVFVLSNTALSPYTIGVGDLVFVDSFGTELQSTQAVTLPAAVGGVPGSVSINVQAVLAGAAGNIPNNSLITMVTPLAGVTVTNPSPGTDGEGKVLPWYSLKTGADAQSNAELQATNASKWGSLSVQKTATAYRYLAIKSAPAITKVAINDANPRGDFTVDVYIAGSLGAVGVAELEAAQNAFAAKTFQTDQYPASDSSRAKVYLAPTVPFVPAGTVYGDPQYEISTIQANVKQALDDFLTVIPLGGRDYSPGPANVLTLGDVLQVLEGVEGVRSVTLTSPTGDTSVASFSQLVPPADYFATLTVQQVTS